MGKAKARKHETATKQLQLHGTKDGFIKKNKDSKFKNTLTGKIVLINNSKGQDKDSPINRGSKVNTKNYKQKPKPFFNNSKQASKGPQSKQNSPNDGRKHKITSKSRTPDLDEISDSDIDEEVTPQDVSLNETIETSEEDSDSDVPDFSGNEPDEDDVDFEDEEEEDDDDSNEEKVVERKGVKMFNGLSEIKKNDGKKTQEEEDDDDDDESESDENMTSSLGKSDESDDDEDEDEDEETDDNHRKQVQNIKDSNKGTSVKIDSRCDSDDVDDDSEDSDDSSDSSDDSIDTELGIKKLLKESITEDDLDKLLSHIYETDEDDEENGVTEEYKVTEKKADEVPNEDQEREMKKQEYLKKRLVLVNNVSKLTRIRDLDRMFSHYGNIRKIELKCIPNLNLFSSIASEREIPRDYPELKIAVAFIVYEGEESAEAAANELNGKRYDGNYLNVLTVRQLKEAPSRKTILYNNPKFYGLDIENYLWELFSKYGKIKRLCLMRDYKGLSKGFGYVFMETEAAAHNAVENIAEIYVRLLYRSFDESENSNKNDDKEMKQGAKRINSHDKKSSKKLKTGLEKPVASNIEQETINKQKKQEGDKETKSTTFQDQKIELKNKKKNKLDKKKKKMAETHS